jgi:hypothetical protein
MFHFEDVSAVSVSEAPAGKGSTFLRSGSIRFVCLGLHWVAFGHRGELAFVADRLVRQVIEKAAAAGKLFGDVFDELLVANLGARPRGVLAVLGDRRRTRKPYAHERGERLGQGFDVSPVAVQGAAESIRPSQKSVASLVPSRATTTALSVGFGAAGG